LGPKSLVNKYGYTEQEWAEIEHMARLAIPGRAVLQRATLPEDFGGVDIHFKVDYHCDLQIRLRKNRPAYAADRDVTFRDTEWRPIQQGTYAPLMLFIWLTKGFAVAGKLIDIYRMDEEITPPLRERESTPNSGDETGWVAVEIVELVRARALLRQGDRNEWAAAALGGNERTRRIIDHSKRATA
jgi:hypothetical protein